MQLNQGIEAVHTDAWGFYDAARSRLDEDYLSPEEPAIERPFAAIPTIEALYRFGNPHARNNLFETVGKIPVAWLYLGRAADAVGGTNLLSLVPGQDFAASRRTGILRAATSG